MPAYDFVCHQCGKRVEIRRPSRERLSPFQCPHCESWNTRRVFTFAAALVRRGENDVHAPSLPPRSSPSTIVDIHNSEFLDNDGGGIVNRDPNAVIRSTGNRYSGNRKGDVINEGTFESTDDRFE